MIEPLRVSFDVECSAEHAFWTWTSRASSWWPKEHTMSGEAINGLACTGYDVCKDPFNMIAKAGHTAGPDKTSPRLPDEPGTLIGCAVARRSKHLSAQDSTR